MMQSRLPLPLLWFGMSWLVLNPNYLAAQQSVYSGAFILNEGSLTSSSGLMALTNFETSAGKTVSIVNYFFNWQNGSGFVAFPTNTADAIRAHGSIPLLSWQPWQGNFPDPAYSLTNIINGNFDSYITSFALQTRAWGHPFFLRFAHEMNGNWYPWAESTNGNASGEYVQAWRHVHNIFTAVGVTNVTWVWCVNVEFSGSTAIAELYPGDNYVDWISLDAYNRLANPWQDLSGIAPATLTDLTNIAPGKPIMLAETGCHEPTTAEAQAGDSKGQWFTNALSYYIKTVPRIKAYVYENATNSDGNNWLITTSANSLAGYEYGIGLSYYAGSGFGTIFNSPIQPLLDDALPGDTMPPFVSILEPQVNYVRMGSTVQFLALASADKINIAQVMFLTNGVTASTQTVPPYAFNWTAPTNAGSNYTITAEAFDTAGNSANSTIQVITRSPQTVNLTNSDALGTTSFDWAGNWDSGQLPMAGNDYVVGPAWTLRTPTDNQLYTFAGDSLILAGTLAFKQTNVITVANLQLTNGTIVNLLAGGPPDAGRLAGTINVVTNGIINAGDNDSGTTCMQILASLTGNGGLSIVEPDIVTLSASNAYNGPLIVSGSTLQLDGTGSITPSQLALENYVGSSVTNNAATNIIQAGGVLNVGYGPSDLLRVGYRTSASLGITNCVAVLNVSAQPEFAANVGEFSVGNNTVNNDNFTTVGSVYLATNNTVTATNIVIGESSFAGTAATSVMVLGGGSNYFSTPQMTVGSWKVNGQLTLPSGGVFRLDDNGGPAELTVGGQNLSTSTTCTGILNAGGGIMIANLGTLTIGMKAGGNSGAATGTMTIGTNMANNLNAGNVIIGSMAGASSGSPAASGTLVFGGGSFLVSGNVTLGSFDNGLGSATGTLNVNGGTFSVTGSMVSGGGTGIVNINSGTLALSNNAGTSGLPITQLNLTNAALYLNVNGNSLMTNIVASTVNVAGSNGITIESVANVSGSAIFPLMSYTGADPFAHLSLATLPVGYAGSLVDNQVARRIDLGISQVGAPMPAISSTVLDGTSLMFQVTNSQSGFNYVLQATPQLAPTDWINIQTNPGGGTLVFTVPIAPTKTQQFFRIWVP
jgi:hypothetical protein